MALTVGVNSYITVAEAGTYFADSLRVAEWEAYGSSTKAAALVDAARYMERLNWRGERTGGASQVLAFPRSGLEDRDGYALSSATVPQQIKDAQAELALKLAADPTIIDKITNPTGTNIKRVKADTVEVEFFNPSQSAQLVGWLQSLLEPFLDSSALASGLAVGGSVGGTDSLSSFLETNEYGRSSGFA